MKNDLEKMGTEAKAAIAMLKTMQKSFMAGKLTYDEMKEVGKPLVATFNAYAKALAKERKMPYKPITLGYFLR